MADGPWKKYEGTSGPWVKYAAPAAGDAAIPMPGAPAPAETAVPDILSLLQTQRQTAATPQVGVPAPRPMPTTMPDTPPPGVGADPQRAILQAMGLSDDAKAARGTGRASMMDDGTLSHIQPNPVTEAKSAPLKAPKKAMSPLDVMRRQMGLPPDESPEPVDQRETFGALTKRRGQEAAQGASSVLQSIARARAIDDRTLADAIMRDAPQRVQEAARQTRAFEKILARGLSDDGQSPMTDEERATYEKRRDEAAEAVRQWADVAEFGPAFAGNRAGGAETAADDLKKWTDETFGVPPEDDSIWSDLAYGAGSMAAFVVPSIVAGPGGVAVTAQMGADAAKTEAYDRAVAQGASERDAQTAASLAGFMGTAEAIPIAAALNRLPRSMRRGVMARIGRFLSDTAKGGLEEAIQEGGLAIVQNLIERGVYDPEQQVITKDVGDQALVGLILGGFLGGGANIVGAESRPSAVVEKERGPIGNDDPPEAQEQAPKLSAPPGTAAPPAPQQPETAPEAVREAPAAPEQPEAPQAPVAPQQPPVAPRDAAPEAEPQQEAQGGRVEIMDEVETVDGETRPTGRQVRVNLDTGEVSPVEDEAATPPQAPSTDAAQGQPPEREPVVGSGETSAAGQREEGEAENLPSVDGARPGPGRVFLDHQQTIDVQTDPETFQYKGGGDTEGVTDRLQGVDRFDPVRAGQVILYERADGSQIVADGHQRTGLARRKAEEGQEDVGGMSALIYREKDGYTPDDVMLTAALKNIGEGSGTAVDAARILRKTGKTARDLGLPPKSALVRDAEGISKLSDDAYAMVVNEVASERDGGIVGRSVEDAGMHAEVLKILTDANPGNAAQAEMIARDAAAESVEQTQDSLFGAETTRQPLYKERAQILDGSVKALKRDRAAFNTVLNQAGTLESAGNRLDADANSRRVADDDKVLQYLQTQATRKGPISDALTDAAKRLATGEITVEQARKRFVENVRGSGDGGGEGSQESPARGRDGAARQETESRPERREESVEPKTERTEAGEQTLAPGVEPVTDRQRAETEMAKPKRGGDAGAGSGRDDLFGDPADRRDLFDDTTTTKYQRQAIETEFDSAAERALFYSPLYRAIAGAKQKSAPAKDWKAIIGKMPGVKRAEMEWMGVGDWLDAQEGQVTREELGEFVRQSQIEIVQDVLADRSGFDDAGEAAIEELHDETGMDPEDMDPADIEARANEILARNGTQGATRFEEYTEPGGENYREILLRVPTLHETGKNRARGRSFEQIAEDMDSLARRRREQGLTDAEEAQYTRLVEERRQNSRNEKNPFVQSAHFEQENIVVHARVKDREGPNGERVLFIEEIQSDLASKWREIESPETTARRKELRKIVADAARKFGEVSNDVTDAMEAAGDQEAATRPDLVQDHLYARLMDSREQGETAVTKAAAEAAPDAYSDLKRIAKEHNDAERELLGMGTDKSADPTLPDTPFKEEHTYSLMTKRLLRMAAEEGYDRVSWTPGYMQAERWDSAAQSVVEGVRWSRESASNPKIGFLDMARGDTIMFSVTDDGKAFAPEHAVIHDKPLSQIVGPKLAEQIMTEPKGKVSGQKITFPDSGYAIAYDQQTRKAVDRIAKGTGAKVYVDKTLPDFGTVQKSDMLDVVKGLRNEQALDVARAIVPDAAAAWAEKIERNGPTALMDFRSGRLADGLEAAGIGPQGKPVWSIDITDALREKANQPQPILLRPIPGANAVTPQAARSMLPKLRAELDRLNLQRVRLRLDQKGDWQGAFVFSPYGPMDIVIGQSLDPEKTLYHESIHAMKALNLFTDGEWDALHRKAEAEWLEKHKIAERYPDLTREERVEEAIAEAFAEHAAAKKSPRGSILIRAFNKIARLMRAVRNAVKGANLTAEDVFGAVLAGDIGARDAGSSGFVKDVQVKMQNQPAAQGPGSLMDGPLHVPDRRVWDELTAANAGIIGRLKGGAAAAHDALDRARFRIQDRFLPVLRAQQAIERASGEALPDHMNAYVTEETFYGRAGTRLDDIDQNYTRPVIDIIARTKGLTADMVGDWLTARHAEERNARIAKINKAMPDAGSGMTNAEARRILKEMREGPHRAELEQISDLLGQMRDDTLKLRVEAGLMTQEDADTLKVMYKHYVPLKGFAETDNAEASLDTAGVGAKYTVRGAETQRALGRRSRSFNPLMAAITQAQEVAIRAEKNRVGQAVYNLATSHPSKKMWTVKDVQQKRFYNKTTGMVETRAASPLEGRLEPNEMAVKVDGKEKRIVFHDARLAEALGSVGADRLHGALAWAAAFNRYLSTTITMLDPEFMIRNAFRDVTAATINVGAHTGTKAEKRALQKAMIKTWPKAWAAVAGGMKGKTDTEWQKHYREFIEAGGKVHFFQLENPESGMKDMESRIRIRSGPMAMRALRIATSPRALTSIRDNPVLGFVERMNLATENAVRLAAFVEARKRGWSAQKAASLAKNLTVNFNRRGTETGWLNSLFLFFNAATQGVHVIAKAMATKRGLKVMGVLMAYGFLKEMLNASLSEEDDDGMLAYDKIPDYKRRMSDIWMVDGENAVTIPLPYIYAVFPYAGQQIARVMRGQAEEGEAIGEILITLSQQTSPLQITDGFSGIVPTALELPYQLATNQDWLGRPIRPPMSYNDYGPEAYKYYPGVTEASKNIADFLNRATGGSASESGLVDISPEYIDHTIGFLTGGAGKTAGRAADTVAKVMNGEDIEARDVPLARQVHYKTEAWLDRGRFYDNTEVVKDAHARVKNAEEMGERPAPRYLALNSLYTEVNKARREMRDLNRTSTDLRAMKKKLSRDEFQRRMDILDRRQQKVYDRINRAVLLIEKRLKERGL